MCMKVFAKKFLKVLARGRVCIIWLAVTRRGVRVINVYGPRVFCNLRWVYFLPLPQRVRMVHGERGYLWLKYLEMNQALMGSEIIVLPAVSLPDAISYYSSFGWTIKGSNDFIIIRSQIALLSRSKLLKNSSFRNRHLLGCRINLLKN